MTQLEANTLAYLNVYTSWKRMCMIQTYTHILTKSEITDPSRM